MAARRAVARASRADLVGARTAGRRGRRRAGRPRTGGRAPGGPARAEQRRVRGGLPRRAAGRVSSPCRSTPAATAAERDAMLRRCGAPVAARRRGRPTGLDGTHGAADRGRAGGAGRAGAPARSPPPGIRRRSPPWSTPPAPPGEPEGGDAQPPRPARPMPSRPAALDLVGPQTTVLGRAAALRGVRAQRRAGRLAPVRRPVGDHGRLRRASSTWSQDEAGHQPAGRPGAALPDAAATSGRATHLASVTTVVCGGAAAAGGPAGGVHRADRAAGRPGLRTDRGAPGSRPRSAAGSSATVTSAVRCPGVEVRIGRGEDGDEPGGDLRPRRQPVLRLLARRLRRPGRRRLVRHRRHRLSERR